MSHAKCNHANPKMSRFLQVKQDHDSDITALLDNDVLELIKQHAHNQKDRERLNAVIRLLFA
ncbi:hypothetical protein LP090_08720 [Moraxella bovis]|uniref:hypothetical protein n=1 Tax=Moraxella bovis TaxID=476 RepID=UPI0022279E45|nr:hypothetical protein [Moraxella bovis]UYZ69300.1 hypothetical protein LP122_04265 [Moraxella bovis]UYZ71671.1 hypothetical protein LP089_04310 [Moraxella bovis]UYZ72413.1 hypothetical protein LP105_08350 [Moraxella bovis]UZA14969.1 hypothetical protein LP102_04260 [Moraxella bovis]UZA26672.1 hypothetical protein LP119_08580 [Moraxella bovis]